jgi:hypothetical protein
MKDNKNKSFKSHNHVAGFFGIGDGKALFSSRKYIQTGIAGADFRQNRIRFYRYQARFCSTASLMLLNSRPGFTQHQA